MLNNNNLHTDAHDIPPMFFSPVSQCTYPPTIYYRLDTSLWKILPILQFSCVLLIKSMRIYPILSDVPVFSLAISWSLSFYLVDYINYKDYLSRKSISAS